MKTLFTTAAILQAILVLFDELMFHHRRGLASRERWGHPLDTLSFAIPIGLLVFAAGEPLARTVFIVSAVASCLCITKDEWKDHVWISPAERWIHAVLFLLHPVVLLSGYLSWDDPSPLLPILLAGTVILAILQIFFSPSKVLSS